MRLFQIIVHFGIIFQTFVYAGHSRPATQTGGVYQGHTSLGSQTAPRVGSRFVSASQNFNSGIPRRGGPRVRSRHIVQQPHFDAMAYQRHLRNYQALQNRNMIRPILTQPLALPLIHRPPDFHQNPSELMRFDMRKPVKANPIFGVSQFSDIVQQRDLGIREPVRIEPVKTEKNSLLILLEERRPVIRDESDLLSIRKHLIEINNVGSIVGLDKDRILERQVKHIENITDIDIQREVLKIFVKDMVEKSGFLSQNVSNIQDIEALKALVDKISSVTNKFSNNAQQLAIQPMDILGEVRNMNTGVIELPSTTDRPMTNSENHLRQKILDALSNYDRNAHVPQASSDLIDTRLDTFKSRRRSDTKPSAGMSIFGDVNVETTTSLSQTTEMKRDSLATEPLGGNNAYWTHLRAGLVDMLCSLCQQQRRESCIIRYCSNDFIRTETETPAPSAVINSAK